MKSLFNTVGVISNSTSRWRQITHCHLLIIFFLSTDLSNCKLISFPDGVFKVLRSVSEDIRVITLADNEMKVISSKFFSTFTNLRGAAQYTPICLINLAIFHYLPLMWVVDTESGIIFQNWTCRVTSSPNSQTSWQKWSIWPPSVWPITLSPFSLISLLK